MAVLSLLVARPLLGVEKKKTPAEEKKPDSKKARGESTPTPKPSDSKDAAAGKETPAKSTPESKKSSSAAASTPEGKKEGATKATGRKETAAKEANGKAEGKKEPTGNETTGESSAKKGVDAPANGSNSEGTPGPNGTAHAPNASLEPSDLKEFAAQPERVQQLLTAALALTRQNLTYQYGSADPSLGGMDCSGTVYFLLRAQGFPDVPRDSSGQYVWVRKEGGFQAVVSKSNTSFEFAALRPGDLLFWSGTYQSGRDIPISHVMIYLGTEKRNGKPVMFGASDGRSYDGVGRWGVSVFDFKMPKTEAGQTAKVDFIGYGPIPGLRTVEPK